MQKNNIKENFSVMHSYFRRNRKPVSSADLVVDLSEGGSGFNFFLNLLSKNNSRRGRADGFKEYIDKNICCSSAGKDCLELESSAVAYDNFGFLVYATIAEYASKSLYFEFCFDKPPSFGLYENICKVNPSALELIIDNEHFMFYETLEKVRNRFYLKNVESFEQVNKFWQEIRDDFLVRFPLHSFTSKLASEGRLSCEIATKMAKRYPIQNLVLTRGYQPKHIQEMILEKNSAALFFLDVVTEEQAILSVFKNPQACSQVRGGTYRLAGWLYANYENLERFPAAVDLRELFCSSLHIPKTGHDKMSLFEKILAYQDVLARYGISFEEIYEKTEKRILNKIQH